MNVFSRVKVCSAFLERVTNEVKSFSDTFYGGSKCDPANTNRACSQLSILFVIAHSFIV